MEKLSDEFFAQPPEALGDETFQLIYSEAISRLRSESPDADMTESMLMERVTFLYVHIRNKETKKAFAHDRAYKETLQLWVQMAAALHKKRLAEVDIDAIRDKLVSAVHLAVSDAAKAALPPDIAKDFQSKLLEELEGVGLG